MERGRKGKKERRPVGKWKEGKVGTASRPEGKEEGSNTLVARGPANFFEVLRFFLLVLFVDMIENRLLSIAICF